MKQYPSMEWMRDDALGVYISIPFCRSKCTYCNFASGVYPASAHVRYVERLIADMAAAPLRLSEKGLHVPRTVDTIYLGGGTPTLLAPDLMHRLFSALRSRFSIDPAAEITVECAPGQLSDPMLAALVAIGVNRVSLGVQSFIDREAHESGRLHSRSIVLDDLRRLRAAGIDNINLDLIAGLAGQTFATWGESLSVLLDCDTPHASVYMLEVDDDSRLGRELLNGGTRYHAGLVPSDDAIARMYETAIERFDSAGLKQYEISNFARPGFESRHNLRYWNRRPYLGLGLDASSMAPEAGPPSQPSGYVMRWKTTDDLKAYLDSSESDETAWLSPERNLEEAWFLGLRLNAGVSVAALQQEFGRDAVAPALPVVERLQADGLLTFQSGQVRLTPQGRLLSNDVFQEFLGISAQSHPAAATAIAP